MSPASFVQHSLPSKIIADQSKLVSWLIVIIGSYTHPFSFSHSGLGGMTPQTDIARTVLDSLISAKAREAPVRS